MEIGRYFFTRLNMTERHKGKKEKVETLTPPTTGEIKAYLQAVANGEIDTAIDPNDFFSARRDRLYRGENVRLVNRSGKFIGWGSLGSHDWFHLTNGADGKEKSEQLHHEHASVSFWMTTLDNGIGLPLFGDVKKAFKKLKP